MDDFKENDFGETSGSQYLTGFIGALLGGIVGSIPYIAFAFILNTLVRALAFLFGFISIKGYELFRGPRKRWYANLVVLPITVIIKFLLSIFFSFGDMSNAAFTMIFGLAAIMYVLSESKRFVYGDEPILLTEKEDSLNINQAIIS